jgi:DNA mismatch repair ATPase MutS
MEREHIYQSKIEDLNQKKSRLKSKLLQISLLRLVVFLICAAGIYMFWSTTFAVVGFVLAFIISFIFLIKIHSTRKRALHKTKLIIKINEDEISALHGNFDQFYGGKRYKDSKHAFAEDIDLFGDFSFFQFVNRTGLIHGEKRLAENFKSNECNDISQKQSAVKDLAERLDFRQGFTAEAQMLEKQKDLDTLLSQLEQHNAFVPKYMYSLSLIFSVLSLGVVILYATETITEMQLVLWIFLGLGITGAFLKKINKLSQTTAKAQELFRQYHKLIYAIENEDFKSDLLSEQKKKLFTNNQKASEAIKEFSRYIDALEQRQNLMVGFVLNALSLWDLRQCYKIEKWLRTHQKNIQNWFDVLAFFDAKNSLANLAYNQTTFSYPELTAGKSTILECHAATHPLIPKSQAVVNDFKIDQTSFLIITGANMAGKSTFLRTVSLMIVMANSGLPVCAEQCLYKPTKLITSMRTTDSLSSEASYFFSELSRLKTIVEHIQGENYFIVLDEILKGTNSHDKAKGSKQFVERLVKSKSTGIIATHDLSLCSLAEELNEVKNYYFDAEIIEGELHFDYKFKKGICQNMNASFLLKKMGIV